MQRVTSRTHVRPADLAAGVVVLAFGIVNAVLLPRPLQSILAGGPAVDWIQFVEGGRRVFEGDLYESSATYGYRYSPIVAYVFAAIGGLGTDVWRLLHIGAAFALPTWPMRLVTLTAWPFWYDVETGNVMVFVLLAGAWAMSGSRSGIVSFFLLTLLFPRPLMIPMVSWILWKHAGSRLPMVALTAVHGVAVLATGWADDWLSLLVTLGAEEVSPNNLGPTRFLGIWWLVVGVPIAAVLTWRRRLGWASLAASYPYVLPYYFLMLVLELPRRMWPLQLTGPTAARTPER